MNNLKFKFCASLFLFIFAVNGAVYARWKNPLLDAAHYGNLVKVKMLAKTMGVNATSKVSKKTALHAAVLNKQVSVVEWLLQNGANVNAVTTSNETPLYWAVYDGPNQSSTDSEKIVKLLLKHGADINIESKRGSKSVLAQAVKTLNVEVVKILLERKMNARMIDDSGYPLVHLAISRADFSGKGDRRLIETVKLLLKYGADSKQLDYGGNTALHIAVKYKKVAVARLLKKSIGTMIDHKNKKGKTAIDLELERAQKETARSSSKESVTQPLTSSKLPSDPLKPLGVVLGKRIDTQNLKVYLHPASPKTKHLQYEYKPRHPLPGIKYYSIYATLKNKIVFKVSAYSYKNFCNGKLVNLYNSFRKQYPTLKTKVTIPFNQTHIGRLLQNGSPKLISTKEKADYFIVTYQGNYGSKKSYRLSRKVYNVKKQSASFSGVAYSHSAYRVTESEKILYDSFAGYLTNNQVLYEFFNYCHKKPTELDRDYIQINFYNRTK